MKGKWYGPFVGIAGVCEPSAPMWGELGALLAILPISVWSGNPQFLGEAGVYWPHSQCVVWEPPLLDSSNPQLPCIRLRGGGEVGV